MSILNILDLCWCRFYWYDVRRGGGLPTYGASLGMAFFIELFIVGIIEFPQSIGFYKLPDIPYLPFGLGVVGLILFFLIRNWNKDIREERLTKYQNYKKENPQKEKKIFWGFIIITMGLCVLVMGITQIRYELLQRQ